MFKVVAAFLVPQVVGQFDNTTIDWDSVASPQTVNITIDGAKASGYQRFDVTFTWNESANHSVYLMASKDAFDDCNFTGAVEKTSGDMPLTFFPNPHAYQTLYYACATDCGDGHKVELQVLCDGDNDTAVEQETAVTMSGTYSSIKTCADVVSNSACGVNLLVGGSLPSAKYCVCACRQPVTTTTTISETTTTVAESPNTTTTAAADATNVTTTTAAANTTNLTGTSNVTTTTASSDVTTNGAFPSCPSSTLSLLVVLVSVLLK